MGNKDGYEVSIISTFQRFKAMKSKRRFVTGVKLCMKGR